ncbi:unnamed protein product, partial [Rotaria sordida]
MCLNGGTCILADEYALSHKKFYCICPTGYIGERSAIERTYKQSATYSTTVKSSDRCPNINQLFNKTFVQMHIIRRIKYYHLPCQQHSLNLSCFYDDFYLCFCYNLDKQ